MFEKHSQDATATSHCQVTVSDWELYTDRIFYIEYKVSELIKRTLKITVHHQRPTAATKTIRSSTVLIWQLHE